MDIPKYFLVKFLDDSISTKNKMKIVTSNEFQLPLKKEDFLEKDPKYRQKKYNVAYNTVKGILDFKQVVIVRIGSEYSQIYANIYFIYNYFYCY